MWTENKTNEEMLSIVSKSDLDIFLDKKIFDLPGKNFDSYNQMNNFRNLPFEEQYALSLLNLLENGTVSKDRTGVGTKRIQSQQIHVNMKKGFPILRGKKMNFTNALIEMIWIMSGKTDHKFLKDNGVNYWDSWVKEDGTFGPIYGKQMRDFLGIDQLADVLNVLTSNPDSRRIMVSLWNPLDLPDMSLPPCHHDYQICSFIDNDGIRKLDLHVKQRSADCFLGVPYDLNIFANYFELISTVVEIPVNFIHITMSDFHMYLNHEEQIRKYLTNYFHDEKGIIAHKIMPESTLPDFDVKKAISDEKFKIEKFQDENLLIYNENHIKKMESKIMINVMDKLLQSIIDSGFNSYTMLNYYSYPFIKAPVAV